MKSSVVKRSVILEGHKTSVSLEDEFWQGLRAVAHERDMTPSELIAAIDSDRENANLSSAIRLFVLRFYRDQIDEYQNKTPEQMVLPNTLGPAKSLTGH
jgi:predicted DNA-binding ribbon-helix-helix protein